MIDVFSRRILELRKKKKLTQEKMAAELGVTRQSLSNYEKGERIPDIEVLRVICEKMDCSPNYLLGLQDTLKDRDRKISVELGLSEQAIDKFRANREYSTILSYMFESDTIWSMIRLIEKMTEYNDPKYEYSSKGFTLEDGLLINYEDALRYCCQKYLDEIIDYIVAVKKREFEREFMDKRKGDE